jgi:hypothetical protein
MEEHSGSSNGYNNSVRQSDDTEERSGSRRDHGTKRPPYTKYRFHKRQIRRNRPNRFIRLSFALLAPPTDLEVNALLAALGDDLRRVLPELEER